MLSHCLVDKPDVGRGRFSPDDETLGVAMWMFDVDGWCIETIRVKRGVYPGYAPAGEEPILKNMCYRANLALSSPEFEVKVGE